MARNAQFVKGEPAERRINTAASAFAGGLVSWGYCYESGVSQVMAIGGAASRGGSWPFVIPDERYAETGPPVLGRA